MSIEAVRVLERVGHRKAWLDAQQNGPIAVRRVHVDEERALLSARQRRRDVHRQRRRAHSALGSHEREHPPADRGRALRDDSRDRGADGVGRERLGDTFGHTGPHRLQHE